MLDHMNNTFQNTVFKISVDVPLITKKVFKQKCFSFFLTKNLNWEILTRNLVTFKRWDSFKDEKLSYYEGSVKNRIFKGGEGYEKPTYG